MFKPGTLIEGKYEILDEIGRGGMSIVYLAIVRSANKMWAVKVVRKDGKNDYNIVNQNLIAEIETLKEIKHPKLPEIVDVIDNGDSYIIIMDYIEGNSLDKILEEKGPQSEKDVVEWAKQLCEVLRYLHEEKNIIYRDMKPSNIMLQPNGEVTIVDFGTAKKYIIDSGDTTGLGTAGYAAPEQYGGHGHTDATSDIYALGMTMYVLLTAVDPQKEYIESMSVRKKNPYLSEEIDQIIVKCTQRERSMRYQKALDLLDDLEHIKEIGHKKWVKSLIKVISFAACLLISVGSVIGGSVTSNMAKAKAVDNYDKIISDAAQTINIDDKAELYKQAVGIPNKEGDAAAYLGLIQNYKMNDGNDTPKFTQNEVDEIQKLIMLNRDKLTSEENLPGYVDICFEIGKMIWYYYYDEGNDSSRTTRAKYAFEWFQTVVDKAAPDYENIGLAKVYMNIGMFYRDVSIRRNEANDKGMYIEAFNNVRTLMDTIAKDENEMEIVRLELLEMAITLINQNATSLKRDGVTQDDLEQVYTQIEEALELIVVPEDDEDRAYNMKNNIIQLMSQTKETIETAYGTTKGGKR